MHVNDAMLQRIFPPVCHAELAGRLRKPSGIADVVLDTDTYNEIDDQFAVAYLVRSSPELNVRAITAAPFYSDPSWGRPPRSESPKDGMERSYDEIIKLLKLMDRDDLIPIVHRGSESYLPSPYAPVRSGAAERILELSREYDAKRPLYIVAIGALTNVASALLLDPSLRERAMVVWTGGHAHHMGGCGDFNTRQDISAARVVFGCGIPFVQIPFLGVISEFRFCKAELEELFRGRNRLCDYLIDNTYEFVAMKPNLPHWSKPIWDVVGVAWLLKGDFMLDRIMPSPMPQRDYTYGMDPDMHPMRYVYYIKKDELTADLWGKLTR